MSELAFEVCPVYLDDGIVISTTIDEHFRRLSAVLSKLRDAGLKLKPSKYRLLQKHVAFSATSYRRMGSAQTLKRCVQSLTGLHQRLCAKYVHSLNYVPITVVLMRASPESLHLCMIRPRRDEPSAGLLNVRKPSNS